MADLAELKAQLEEEQLKLKVLYAPVNNGFGGMAYLNQLIFVERLQTQLNRLLKEQRKQLQAIRVHLDSLEDGGSQVIDV